jgi:hypothetical protein
MNSQELSLFFDGAISMGNLGIAIFFFRFWNKTRDWLFQGFGWAFVVLTIERVIIFSHAMSGEMQPAVYLARFVAFCLIILSIIRKNVGGRI